MIELAQIEAAAARHGLANVGAFHPDDGDGAPSDAATVVLLGPAGPEMWQVFRSSPEATDGAPNPLDRWSERTIGEIAVATGATALFPFGGPPWHPFQKWAARGEGAVQSPVGMQASPSRGLWASYRGALAFPSRLALPVIAHTDPCDGCPAPCLTACPASAFDGGHYDVPKCTAHIGSAEGAECLSGCLVRGACPAGAGIGLPADQRRFHMAAFRRAHG